MDTVEINPGDGGTSGAIKRGEDSDGGACESNLEMRLEMRLENGEVLVSHGRAGDRVALLIGIQETDYELPGGTHLRLEPVFVLAFDEAGEYRWRLYGDTSASAPMSVRIQAVSMDENGGFSASGRWQWDYQGESGQFEGRQLSRLELDNQGYGRSVVAIPRGGHALPVPHKSSWALG